MSSVGSRAGGTGATKKMMSAARVYPLADTSIRMLRLVGPAERLAKTDELVIVVPGRVGYLAPGDRLDIAPGEMAFVATA